MLVKAQTEKFVLPVFGGTINKLGVFEPKYAIGTAFPIGQFLFLTAGHVIDYAADYSHVTLGFMRDYENHLQFCPVLKMERKAHPDIGIIMANLIDVNVMAWYAPRVHALDDIVVAHGYPFGYDANLNAVALRHFKGYVVGAGFRDVLRTLIYELSFPCPRGISGAPLLIKVDTEDGPASMIAGLITGNSLVEIDIDYRHEIIETFDENKVKTEIIHKTETTTFGIALQQTAILDLTFDILNGSSIRSHLEKQNLIQKTSAAT